MRWSFASTEGPAGAFHIAPSLSSSTRNPHGYLRLSVQGVDVHLTQIAGGRIDRDLYQQGRYTPGQFIPDVGHEALCYVDYENWG